MRLLVLLLVASCGPAFSDRDCKSFCDWLRECYPDGGGLYWDTTGGLGCRVECEGVQHPAMDEAAAASADVQSCEEFRVVYLKVDALVRQGGK